jgi:hypothetical protein
MISLSCEHLLLRADQRAQAPVFGFESGDATLQLCNSDSDLGGIELSQKMLESVDGRASIHPAGAAVLYDLRRHFGGIALRACSASKRRRTTRSLGFPSSHRSRRAGSSLPELHGRIDPQRRAMIGIQLVSIHTVRE